MKPYFLFLLDPVKEQEHDGLTDQWDNDGGIAVLKNEISAVSKPGKILYFVYLS